MFMGIKSISRSFVALVVAVLFMAGPVQAGNILLYGGNQDIDNIDPATGENYSINAALRRLYDAFFI